MNSGTGIRVTTDDIQLFDNTIIDCTVGIQIVDLKDSDIYKNTITSTIDDSFGITSVISKLDNISIRENTLKLKTGRSISLRFINANESDKKFTIKNNTFECGKDGLLVSVNGADVIDNNFSLAGLGINNSNTILFKGNTINSNLDQALNIGKAISTRNVIVTENTIASTGSFGIKLNKIGTDFITENANILIEENTVSAKRNAIHSTNFDDVTIRNNNGTTEISHFIFFRGNNSSILDNKTNLSAIEGVDVEGSNNTISGNNN